MPRESQNIGNAAADRAAARRRAAERRDKEAFASFFARDAVRAQRRQARRKTILISVAIHVIALGSLVVYSFWDVEELFGPSVEVKIFAPAKLPAGVLPAAPTK